MIITKTPFRISLFGGGSDYPSYFKQYGGKVLGATIDKYCWLMVRKSPSFGHPYKIVYSKTEEKDTLEEIEHSGVRATLKEMDYANRLEIYHTSDLPARSGVGSSSAFIVGLVKAISKLKKEMWTDNQVAEKAIYIEQNVLNETVGCQDQILCSYGGINYMEFPKEGIPIVRHYFEFVSHPARCSEVLEKHLLLFYTGIQRTATDVASSYVDKLSTTYERVMKKIVDSVDEGVACLADIARGGNPDRFGHLLDESWHLKKQIQGVSNPRIDEIYDRAWVAGALGGKVCGAGGGGHMLFYVPLEKQEAVRQALGDLVEIPFKFSYTGCEVVHGGEG